MHVAVLGFGYWGPNLVRNLLDNRGCSSVTICDRDEAQLERARSRFPHVRTVSNADEVWRDTSLEAVLIATPVSTHYPLAKAALEAGKHTFVEKPMAASAVEAEDLVRLAEERGRTLMVGHTFEYSPPAKMRTSHSVCDGSSTGGCGSGVTMTPGS